MEQPGCSTGWELQQGIRGMRGPRSSPPLLMALIQSNDGTWNNLCLQPSSACLQTKSQSHFSCLAPAMALHWLFFHDPVLLIKPPENSPRKKKKQNTKFHLGQSELSKGQVSSSMGTQRGCCTQSGEQGRWRNKPPVLTAVY